MPYCITLRSRTDARVTGWYTGRNTPWSTDHTRQKRFDNKHDTNAVCHELRSVCPRNTEVINIEIVQDDRDRGGESLGFRRDLTKVKGFRL
jgi:hypothetical protein